MRDYRKTIAEMTKQAQVSGDAPFVRLDIRLFNDIAAEFGHSLANVSLSILSGGRNQVKRLAAALGPKYLFEFYLFLKLGRNKFADYEGYHELFSLTEQAVDIVSPRLGIEPKQTTPDTVEELLNTPIHPDVQDIKASYRSLILQKASKIK